MCREHRAVLVAGVRRLRRALLLLAVAATAAGGLLYWRQQRDDLTHRPAALYSNEEPQWSWICRNDRCERLLASEASLLQSLATCNMLCASPQLWPQPTGRTRYGSTAVAVGTDSMLLQVLAAPSSEVREHLHDAFALMKQDIQALQQHGQRPRRQIDVGSPRPLYVRVTVDGSGDVRMRLNTDESYKLKVTPEGNIIVAEIHAKSFCGARHGFETLSQLIWMDSYADSFLVLESAFIEDAPKFKYRGLLLDTARNFFPVAELIRTMDAMGANKMNTFHWHATDSQSFPLQLSAARQLWSRGAYGSRALYSAEDVRAVVRRARLRGVRVLLEVDAPAHVGRAWDWGRAAGLGDLAYCVEAQPWQAYCGEPPCGQLNPRNTHVYDILEKIYREIIELTGVDDLFHLGGDEVNENCWQRYINDTDPMDLWMEFTEKALKALERARGGSLPELTLLWSSRLTSTPYLSQLNSKNIGVQVWGASQWAESHAVLDAGYRTVISHVDAWYLDCGFGSWRDSSQGHCFPYRSWQQMYEHRPWLDENKAEAGLPAPWEGAAPAPAGGTRSATTRQAWRVEGGAACQWSEQLGAGGLDARVWPRTAAVAERLWTDPGAPLDGPVYVRLDTQRARLVSRGLRAAPLWPHWCSQNPYECLTLDGYVP